MVTDSRLKKIESNARAIKTIISLLIVTLGLIYGLCIFIYQSKSNTETIAELKVTLAEHKSKSDTKIQNLETKMLGEYNKLNEKHNRLNERMYQNEKNFEMTAKGLDTSLAKISTDLQFIKERLIDKALGNSENVK